MKLHVDFANRENNLFYDGSGSRNHIESPTPPTTEIADISFGSAGVFNGSNQYLQANSTGLSSSALTISAFIYLPSAATWNNGKVSPIVVCISGSNAYGLATSATNNYVSAIVKGTTTNSASSLITRDNWHHLAMTWNGSLINLYINGESRETYPGNLATVTTSNINIGGPPTVLVSAAGSYYNGKLADVRIYDRVLSPEEVFALANAPFSIESDGKLNARGVVESVAGPRFDKTGILYTSELNETATTKFYMSNNNKIYTSNFNGVY